jgi:acyl transferase domain-containing protein
MEANHLTIRNLPSQADSTELQNEERMLPISHEHTDPALSVQNTHEGASAEKLLIFSAADEEGINRIAAAYGNHFRSSNMSSISSNKYLDSLSYTLDSRRSSLAWKSFGVLKSVEELQNIEQVVSHPIRTNTAFKPSFTFIFTGQGAQWPRMGVELMERYSVFRHYLEICAIALKESGCPWDLIGIYPSSCAVFMNHVF